MNKISKSKFITIGLIFSFILFYSPYLLRSEVVGKGNLIGFVYGEDGSTPVEGATVKMRNVSTGSVYESSKSDKQGIFKLKAIDEGLYVVGISTERKNFNVDKLIGIKPDETAKVSFSLKSDKSTSTQEEITKKKKTGLAGFFLSPAGIVTIIAASTVTVYTLVKLLEEEPEASPFRK